jgi:twitching motility protein PilU
MLKRGLILMVGAAGAGKSTTLAAMINYRNETSSDHILTIEDPIEFLHTNKKSIVNQREVGSTPRASRARCAARVRAAPDVILVGEIRDRETMEAAINAGRHRAPVHRDPARQQLRRDARSHHQHVPARPAQADLPGSVAVPARDPVAAAGDGEDRQRVAASEVMVNTPHMSELIKRATSSGSRKRSAPAPSAAC